ncbi:MAG: extensin family protein [Novosphingobium sp.]|nr:extensin family protein [Novosphingobium sp.]
MRRFCLLLPLAATLSACIDIPQASQASKRQSVQRSTSFASARPEVRQCLADLSATRANFTPLPDQYYGAGCSTLNTVKLSSLRSDNASLGIANLGPVTCPLANSFAGWARYGVDRAARQILGSQIVRIETFGSYNCRNVAGTSRRSAHATGNAIDVSGFVLADGRHISVLGDWSSGTDAERRFLRVVQDSACKRFGTVLGPNYNAAHRDHFHLEFSTSNFCR